MCPRLLSSILFVYHTNHWQDLHDSPHVYKTPPLRDLFLLASRLQRLKNPPPLYNYKSLAGRVPGVATWAGKMVFPRRRLYTRRRVRVERLVDCVSHLHYGQQFCKLTGAYWNSDLPSVAYCGRVQTNPWQPFVEWGGRANISLIHKKKKKKASIIDY